MFVITRKRKEQFVARMPDGTQIAFAIGRIRGNQVGIVIDAPEEVKVIRAELLPEGLPIPAEATPDEPTQPTTPKRRNRNGNKTKTYKGRKSERNQQPGPSTSPKENQGEGAKPLS